MNFNIIDYPNSFDNYLHIPNLAHHYTLMDFHHQLFELLGPKYLLYRKYYSNKQLLMNFQLDPRPPKQNVIVDHLWLLE